MTTKEQMHTILHTMLGVIEKKIGYDLAKGKNIELCLDAYNQWEEDERDGIDYIFNIDDPNDLKYLVDNDMITANGIAFVLSQEIHLFMFEGEKDAGIRIVSMDELLEKLFISAYEYMAYAIMYVGRCEPDSPYAKIYEEYVTNYIKDYFK